MSLLGSLGSITNLLPIGGGNADEGDSGGLLGGGLLGGLLGDGGLLGGLLGGGGGIVGGVLGGHDDTLVDTGTILGETDAADGHTSPIIDLDLDSAPREEHQIAAVDLGLLPEMENGQNLLDADLLSGSYGSNYLISGDIGPDGFGPVLTGSILGNPDNPLDLQLLGTPVPDLLGGDLLGGLHL